MTREITFMEAAMEALAEEMRRDEKVFHKIWKDSKLVMCLN